MPTMRRVAIVLAVAVLTSTLAGLPRHAQAELIPKNIPVTVMADKLDYDRVNDVYTAVGHVKIEQEGVRLEAEKVVLYNKTGEAEAEGKVYLQDKDNVIHAERMKINLNTREGIIYQGNLFMKKDNYHMKGEVIERRSETMYHVEQGEFTTCDKDEWFIKAKQMNIDLARYATGSDVTLNMAGMPVLYTPYFLFPVRRSSGFLIPVVGYSTSDGFYAENAYFWAISDSRDMTIYSDFRAWIGYGTGIEYRYNNSQDSMGQVYYKYWDIYHTDVSRWDFRLKHQEEFADDLSAKVDINLVSDFNYYFDLEKPLEMRSKPYIDSNAFYVERWNTASLYLLGQYSTDLTQINVNTIQKLPEIRYTIYDENLVGPLHLNFEGSATNFYTEAGNGTRRVDFNPELTAALGIGGLSLTPRIGARTTFYDRSADSVTPTERRYAYAGLDLNARISRVFGSDSETGVGRIRHSIEPMISYTYIPYIEQGNIPQLDSLDYIVTQNTITFSIINRLTAHYKESKDAAQFSTFDLMVFKLSQSYDLNAVRNQNSLVPARSVILGELYVKTPKAFTLNANAAYDTYARVVSSRSIGASYTASAVSLNLSENYLQNPATHYVIGGGTLKLGKWDFGGQWWRDIENKKTTEADYSLRYTTQCWGIITAYSIKPGETRFTVMLDLKGFGSKGKSK